MSNFSYSATVLQSLEDIHSSARLSRYTAMGGGSTKEAIDFYVWNTAVSAAFYGPLQAVEIGLRNALHRELSALFGMRWHDNRKFLMLNAPFLENAIQKVKDELIKSRKPVDTHQIVAGLNFGFWNQLLGGGPSGVYVVKLWKAGLRNAFPGASVQRYSHIFGEIKQIRDFRNRIAHHDPIFYRNLQNEYDRIKRASFWMYPDLADWIDYHSRCQEMISHCPRPRQFF